MVCTRGNEKTVIFCLFAENYRAVEQRLQYHKTETEQLITIYYTERLFRQLAVESTEYGVLSVRAYFHHDSLCVEVLNARDVIPLDPNGQSGVNTLTLTAPGCNLEIFFRLHTFEKY